DRRPLRRREAGGVHASARVGGRLARRPLGGRGVVDGLREGFEAVAGDPLASKIRQGMTAMAERLLAVLAGSGARRYGGEVVSELEHALQCAELARAGAADEELQ